MTGSGSNSQISRLRIELPLYIHNSLPADQSETKHFGTLLLMKDMRSAATEPYLLKRVEQLRRSMTTALERLDHVRSDAQDFQQ